MENKITLDARNSEIFIERLRIPNPDTYNFLKDKENIANWVIKALIIGCVGLRQMVLTENVDFVEKEFNKFIAKAKETFEKQSNNINEKIDSTFSLNNTFIFFEYPTPPKADLPEGQTFRVGMNFQQG